MRRRNLRAGGIDDTASKLDTYRTTHPTCSRRPAMSTETIDLTQLTGDYTIDASHSTPGFTARHAMLTKLRGASNELDGTVHADGAYPSNSLANLTIKAALYHIPTAARHPHPQRHHFLPTTQPQQR